MILNLSKINIGGYLWINLVNTLFINEGVKTDFLKNQEHLLVWLTDNDLIDKNSTHTISDSLLLKIKALRNQFIDILEGIDKENKIPSAPLLELNKLVTQLPIKYEYSLRESIIENKIFVDDIEGNILLRIIDSLRVSIMEHSLIRLKKCGSDHCILYFMDTSKAGKRKWCNMETYGNRAKATKHYHKRKKDSGTKLT